jgi:hypothetical protein
MCIPPHSLKTLLIRTIKLSSAFLKKQRLKNSNVLLSRFKASRNTLKFCLLCSDKKFKLNVKLRQHRYTSKAYAIVILELLKLRTREQNICNH